MADDFDWEVEAILAPCSVRMRAHKGYFRGGLLLPGVFQKKPPTALGLSVDWSKYSSPAESISRARNPLENKIIQLSVECIRQIRAGTDYLEVKHTPTEDFSNRAHADVLGLPDARLELTEIRVRLHEIHEVIDVDGDLNPIP